LIIAPNKNPPNPKMLPIYNFRNFAKIREMIVVRRAIVMTVSGIPIELWALFKNNSNIK